ncbi:MAG: thiamine-phosphate kinase [Nitrosomonadales bacterium]|jgi:thiamine-monophosphate kinase|nr:thiamine-phosphate kinase [Nitrosomonadales bacterium]MBT4571712.1 thiamine-phosphate kinase [Nitrosomonadales bacterium]MBT4759145.1 thiamine-phosphate kinase [Nitrosomonadales bacterium]MBT5150378.1 thiamine-phosphate kinase [Nitrosomonadales bacterium]MBT6250567.1 thiamine-phosphate kinase [Nitrosomonadales bacterium]
MKTEFEIIEKFFNKKAIKAHKGIGDDAALIEKDGKTFWAISTDMLNEKVHFMPNTDPYKLGWKAMAVNVSDLLAMGASPMFALLSIALPKSNSDWLKKFSKGFFECGKKYNVELIGGDTTKGPLTINVTILGDVNKKNILLRSNAKIGDDIWVTGELGLAALGLKIIQKKINAPSTITKKSINALEKPKPNMLIIEKIKPFCNAAIDVSDGFISDLNHILIASKVGAHIFLKDVPMNKWIRKTEKEDLALYGGDDYQTILTAPKKMRSKIEKLLQKNNLELSRVGIITKDKKLHLSNNDKTIKLKKGYIHFEKN